MNHAIVKDRGIRLSFRLRQRLCSYLLSRHSRARQARQALYPRIVVSPSSNNLRTQPILTIGNVDFEIEIAQTPAERYKGLSDRDSLSPMTGMLFVLEPGRATTFSMRGMRFPLDFIWIGEDRTVADTTVNVSPFVPDTRLARKGSSVPVAYTFEINVGEVESLGIHKGDKVRFSGFSVNGDGR